MSATKYRRKLIEVALPLVEISRASKADKDRRVGTIKNLHKWFAAMPLPALRALIFASLVDDPESDGDRQELLSLIRELVPADGSAPSEHIIREARKRIAEQNPALPIVMDPFSGGGSTIVEALRFGLPAVSSDLNPVAALITRTLGELLPEVAQAPRVSPSSKQGQIQVMPFDDFADDLRYYGSLVEQATKERVGSYYPLPAKGKPVAWLWARTVPCRNPMCPIKVPLFGSPWLSKQKGREAFIELEIDDCNVRFIVRQGKVSTQRATKGSGRAQFSCPKCGTSLSEKDLRAAGKAGSFGLQLMAFCLDTELGRIYVGPDDAPQSSKIAPIPDDIDEIELGSNTKNFSHPLYGINEQAGLYMPRQLAILAAFSDEVAAIRDRVIADGGSEQQATAIATILGICVSKMAQANSTLVRWHTREGPSRCMAAFSTQAMPMLWDFAEAYPFGDSVGSWSAQLASVIGLLRSLPTSGEKGKVVQIDARQADRLVQPGTALIVTDPPYFGQINYADLSDYFYLWLRRSLRGLHPDLFGTIATPKSIELVANPARHNGDKDAARRYFIDGFTEVFASLQKASRADLPIIVAYASKQDDKVGDSAVSSAWEALLEAVLAAKLAVVGTWPIEATRHSRPVGIGSNALASYIILVCRPRIAEDVTDKSAFLARLAEELPEAVQQLRKGGVAPLDMGQAAMGPGMKIFSEYREVLLPDGSAMKVKEALAEIDKAAIAVIDGEETEYDATTRFCLQWFRQRAFDVGPYGDADKILRRTGTAIRDLVDAGVVSNTPRSTVTLLDFDSLPGDYDPAADQRISHWEIAMHLAKRFHEEGIDGAARLIARLRSRPDTPISLDRVHRLIHRIFKISERRYTETAGRFNQLGTAWSDIMSAVQNVSSIRYVTSEIDDLFASAEEIDDDDD
ncbi:DUF1156 domain-containing protein [Microbispora hainanensis]|uniref:DUF1156 domain-containing protein n=1 Tax=Microbispora hainanensis TaxID=568844 RepID=A0ABZ1SHR1_9ACTN|nr:DUF1156 domain-containing protein [Microbispora hainanensis]